LSIFEIFQKHNKLLSKKPFYKKIYIRARIELRIIDNAILLSKELKHHIY